MNERAQHALLALNRRFLLDFPADAATRLERMSGESAAWHLQAQPADVVVPVWDRLSPACAVEIFRHLPQAAALALLVALLATDAARLIGALDPAERERWIAQLPGAVRAEVSDLMRHPPNSAGRLMDTAVTSMRETATVGEAIELLRASGRHHARSLFVADDAARLTGAVPLASLVVARPAQALREIARPVSAVVKPTAPQEDVVELLEKHSLAELAVVDLDGRLLGAISHDALVQAVQDDASADIQAMVGASRDERALSPALFTVRKRLPWLQINLVTAFLAAAVVGLFESTIAQFTALAVLLPVVAGQSGNAGAQALAVTMRGLVLNEISLRQWPRVAIKEVGAGFLNGLAIAATCGLGVYLWSRSIGMVLVICLSMVLAMVIAGLAGAVVPILLRRFGQDPAQSSSIILTTVTDVAGFMSFLGIATLLSAIL
ncbi:MAG: magnesium transporter [Burkholderiaceae bacterium]|nr:magnesium transporter [Burkholderiaceae bacterium]